MVPCWVQIEAPFSSLAEETPSFLRTMKPWPSIVVDGREVEAELRVARHGRGRVAGQHVHLARLERREAVLGGERDEANLGRIVEDRRRDGAAEIDVETRPVALGVRQAESGEAGVRAAGQEAFLLHAVQRRLSRGARSRRSSPRRGRRRSMRLPFSCIVVLPLVLTLSGRPLVSAALPGPCRPFWAGYAEIASTSITFD